MKDCFKFFIIKFLLQFLIVFFKVKNFFLKLNVLRLKLSNKRLNFKKFGCKFTVFDTFSELRKEVCYIFNRSH